LSLLVTPVYVWWLIPEPALIIALLVMLILLFWRHRSNIRNLLAGRESRIGNQD
jgi:glycerol-3-phosphate acyltransferase PlsY